MKAILGEYPSGLGRGRTLHIPGVGITIMEDHYLSMIMTATSIPPTEIGGIRRLPPSVLTEAESLVLAPGEKRRVRYTPMGIMARLELKATWGESALDFDVMELELPETVAQRLAAIRERCQASDPPAVALATGDKDAILALYSLVGGYKFEGDPRFKEENAL